jgi:hypothetical protein
VLLVACSWSFASGVVVFFLQDTEPLELDKEKMKKSFQAALAATFAGLPRFFPGAHGIRPLRCAAATFASLLLLPK